MRISLRSVGVTATLTAAVMAAGPALSARAVDAGTSTSSPTTVAAAAAAPSSVTVAPAASRRHRTVSVLHRWHPAASLAVSPSGVAAPRTAVPGWRPVYIEDFGTANATGTFPSRGYEKHWGVYNDGWKDTSHNGTYMPSKVLSVHNGVLDYSIRTENGQHLVAAPWMLDTKGVTYGRYSVRFRSDALPGYKTAWLLWPDSEQWPQGGEIDFPEGDLGPGGTITAFHHFATRSGGQAQFPTRATYAAWHTVTVEWVPGRVTFVLDGRTIGSSTTMVPSAAMHWVLQTETNLDGYAPSSAVRGHVLIDWVGFWRRG